MVRAAARSCASIRTIVSVAVRGAAAVYRIHGVVVVVWVVGELQWGVHVLAQCDT